MPKTYLSILFICFSLNNYCQSIYLTNPSFEGDPSPATVPVGWHACAPETTPDLLPETWGVITEPAEGETFLGLITRQDGSWESIGQRLSAPIEAKDCYAFTVDLAHSSTYSGYNQTLKLRVWLGTNRCEKTQLIFESPMIEHLDWKTYPIKFTSKQRSNYIILEAFYEEGYFSRKGSILIDNITPLKMCPRA